MRAQVPIEVDANAAQRALPRREAREARPRAAASLHHQHLKLADDLPCDPPRGIKDPAADAAIERA